jgi:hypothetical protein
MKTPEAYEKAELDKFLESIGAYVVKPATYGFGQSGHADRVCCIKGYFWAFEVKREGGKMTVLQARRFREINAAGGRIHAGTAAAIIEHLKQWLSIVDP